MLRMKENISGDFLLPFAFDKTAIGANESESGMRWKYENNFKFSSSMQASERERKSGREGEKEGRVKISRQMLKIKIRKA